MLKCDITLGKKFTFNTGDFSSVGPFLTITIKDIDIDKIKEIHNELDIIVDGLYHRQLDSDIKTMGAVKGMGYGKYLQEINLDEIDEVVSNSIKKLEGV